MIGKYFFLTTILVAYASFVTADYEVNCEAYNTQTSADVEGKCTDGEYEGNDSETGNQVKGECEDFGEVDALDLETGEYVYGECEGKKE